MAGDPNFFILGAPKCGTTSIARWLSAHPNVFFAPLKEPHFFNTDDSHRNILRLEDYRRLFRGARDRHWIVGEASTWYLSSQEAVPNILAFCEQPRFLVMLRNPVEMAASLHQHNVYALFEDQTGFEDAWALQDSRRSGRNIPRGCRDPRHLQYGESCHLGAQLAALLERVPQWQVLWIFLDDLRIDPGAEYRKLLQFLGLEDDGRTRFDVANRAKANRSTGLARLIRMGASAKRRLGITRSFGVDSLNTRRQARPSVGGEFLRMLRQYFSPDIARLSRITGRDLSSWVRP